jgi:hypothetical protein
VPHEFPGGVEINALHDKLGGKIMPHVVPSEVVYIRRFKAAKSLLRSSSVRYLTLEPASVSFSSFMF